LLLLQSLPNLGKHLGFVRELPRLELRVEEFAVDGQLETAAAFGDELHVFDALLVLAEKLARQTDGFRLVVSHRAVFEFDMHTWSPLSAKN